MRRTHRLYFGVAIAILATFALVVTALAQAPTRSLSFQNAAGVLRTVSDSGAVDRNGPFFTPLGKAFGTTCEHCHFASDAWSISAAHAQVLFKGTGGTHPLFTPPTASDVLAAQIPANVDTLEKRQVMYNLMTDKGLALVRRTFNQDAADFVVLGVKPPAGFAAGLAPPMIAAPDTGEPIVEGGWYLNYTASSNGGTPQIWVYRRPLPTTNLPFLTAAAWDGQDTRQAPDPVRRSTMAGILDIARATIRGRQTGSSQMAPDGHVYSGAELNTLSEELTSFMFSTTTAQDIGHRAGALFAAGAQGGVKSLSVTVNYFGINDVLEGDLTVVPGTTPGSVIEILSGRPFDPNVMRLFDSWIGSGNASRASIARGQALFNQTDRLVIDDVNGIQSYNRLIGVVGDGSSGAGTTGATIVFPDSRSIQGLSGPVPGAVAGCITCHDAPNVGNHSTRLPINIGAADVHPAGSHNNTNADLNNAGLPVFYLRHNETGEIVKTTDPGRAVISGRWAHIGQFKGPILRGLVNRGPFFHSGAAKTLAAVIDFYDARFQAHFTTQEKADLAVFLASL